MKRLSMNTFKRNVRALGHTKKLHRQGFTLIEMMIATVVFSVGMMAVFVLQLTSINAYSSARDVTQATDTIDRLVSILKTEIEQSSLTSSNDSLYTTNAPFGDRNLEQAISATPWAWVLMTNDPLNETFGTEKGRFCVWARGGFIANTLGEEDAAGPPGSLDTDLRVQIAVVYPGAQQRFSTQCDGIFTQAVCPSDDPNTVLAPELARDDESSTEFCGLRVLHASTIASIPVNTTEQP